jgi:hypothetical protein
LTVARNTKNIMSQASDLTVDIPDFRFELVYYTTTTDWRLY